MLAISAMHKIQPEKKLTLSPHAAIFIFFSLTSSSQRKHLKLIYLRRVSKNAPKSPSAQTTAKQVRSEPNEKHLSRSLLRKLTEPKQTKYREKLFKFIS